MLVAFAIVASAATRPHAGASTALESGFVAKSLTLSQLHTIPITGGSWDDEMVEQTYIDAVVGLGDTVLEIGSNIGRSTAVAAVRAGRTGRVISSEADPQLRDGDLAANLARVVAAAGLEEVALAPTAPSLSNISIIGNIELMPAISDEKLPLVRTGDWGESGTKSGEESTRLGSSTGSGLFSNGAGPGVSNVTEELVETVPYAMLRDVRPHVIIADCEGCFSTLLHALLDKASPHFLDRCHSIVLEHDGLASLDAEADQAAAHALLLTKHGFRNVACVANPWSALGPAVAWGDDTLSRSCFWSVLQRRDDDAAAEGEDARAVYLTPGRWESANAFYWRAVSFMGNETALRQVSRRRMQRGGLS